MKIKKSNLLRFKEISLFCAYKCVFDLSYLFLIAPTWSYIGDGVDINTTKYIIGWIIYACLIVFIDKIFRFGIYGVIVKLFLIFSITASISLYGLKNIPTVGLCFILLFWILFVLSLKLFSQMSFNMKGLPGRIKRLPEKTPPFFNYAMFLFCIGYVLFVSWKYADFRLLTNLWSSHLFRDVANSYQHSIYGYAIGWVALVFLPYLVVKALGRRNYILVLILFTLELLVFSIASAKIYILSFIVTVIVFYLFKKENWGTLITYTLIGLIGLTIIGAVLNLYIDNYTFSYLIYRANGLPSAISYYYYDFFSHNEFLFLRESVLRHFFDSPYDTTFSRIIGYYYGMGGSYSNNMNNGLFGDAYANFGVMGIIIYPVILAFIFRLFVEFGSTVDKRLLVVAIFIIINGSTNASLFTWLLSGGVIVFVIVFMLDGAQFSKRIVTQDRVK